MVFGYTEVSGRLFSIQRTAPRMRNTGIVELVPTRVSATWRNSLHTVSVHLYWSRISGTPFRSFLPHFPVGGGCAGNAHTWPSRPSSHWRTYSCSAFARRRLSV